MSSASGVVVGEKTLYYATTSLSRCEFYSWSFKFFMMAADLPKLAWVATRIGGTGKAFKIRLHKAVFLLQALGFPTRYEFDQYIRGPYSSELADDYERMVEEGLVHEYAKYADVDEEKWGPVVDKLAAEDVLVLEVAATLYDLLSHGWSLEEAKERVMELKPYATGRLVEVGIRLLRELGLLATEDVGQFLPVF